METALVIILSIAAGWFAHSSVTQAIEGRDWKTEAWWAALALADVIGTLFVFRFVLPWAISP